MRSQGCSGDPDPRCVLLCRAGRRYQLRLKAYEEMGKGGRLRLKGRVDGIRALLQDNQAGGAGQGWAGGAGQDRLWNLAPLKPGACSRMRPAVRPRLLRCALQVQAKLGQSLQIWRAAGGALVVHFKPHEEGDTSGDEEGTTGRKRARSG